MARICANCGKTTVVGSSQKHRRGVAGKRWKSAVTKTPRLFKANIQKKGGVYLCAKCIKRLKLDGRLQTASN